MSPSNNGDVTVVDNLLDFQNKLPQVDLYTSDLGFDVSHDYNAQESLHIEAHFGQLLCGLLVLKPGGNMIIKQYTFFKESNICNIALMSHFFEEAFICKPATSKTDNSEIYLVGKKLKTKYDNNLILIMLEKLKNKTTHEPMFNISKLGKEFLVFVERTAKILAKSQIQKIKLNIQAFNEIDKSDKKKMYIEASNKFKNMREKELKEWYHSHKIYKIKYARRLQTKDAFRQTSKLKNTKR